MDLQTIGQELNRRFSEALPEFYKRRIVVWYDEEGEFADQIEGLELYDAKVLRLTESNNFAIKKNYCSRRTHTELFDLQFNELREARGQLAS